MTRDMTEQARMRPLTPDEIEKIDSLFPVSYFIDDDMFVDLVILFKFSAYHGIPAGECELKVEKIRSLIGDPLVDRVDGESRATWGFEVTIPGYPGIPFILWVTDRGTHVDTIMPPNREKPVHVAAFLKLLIDVLLPDKTKRDVLLPDKYIRKGTS